MPATSTASRGRLITGAIALAATTALLAGCAGSPSTPSATTPAGEASSAFPLTISSALGDAVIASEPSRVATWGWGATDAVIALGVTPVAIPSDDYSGGDDRIAPWVEEGLASLGGESPLVLDGSANTLSTEELLTATPDVLLAPYSGITQEEFDEVTGAGVPVVLVEQNAGLALKLASYAYVLEIGTVALEGAAADLRTNDHVRRAYLGG